MQQPQSMQISDSKRKRRKRTDDEGRTFTCKCGKSYLSYPALYTHIKTKHADEPLSKLARSYDGLESPNGYPQRAQRSYEKQRDTHTREKQRQKQKEKQQQQQQKQLQDNYPLYGNSLPQVNNIQALREFLFKYFPNIMVNSYHNYKNEMTLVEKRELKEMKDYWANGRKKEDETFNQVYETPIRFVMAKFMLELEVEVQNSSFKKFIFLFTFAVKRALERVKGSDGYFRENSAAELPALFDTILRDHLLIDNNDFLSNPTVAAKMLYHFGRWLYVNKFTNLSLKYNF